MSRTLLLFIATVLVSCAPRDPVHDACSEKAAQSQALLDQQATQRGASSATMLAEFMNACESQLRADLDEVIPDLQATADAGDNAGKATSR